MSSKNEKSVLGPAGIALIFFVIGCGVLLVGVSQSRDAVMLMGGLIMGISGGLAALMGDKLSQDFVRFQGGGPARRAREDAERKADTEHSDLTMPEEWDEPPKRDG